MSEIIETLRTRSDVADLIDARSIVEIDRRCAKCWYNLRTFKENVRQLQEMANQLPKASSEASK